MAWKLNKSQAMVLAAFTLWPVVYLVIFMGVFVATFLNEIVGLPHHAGPPVAMLVLIPLHLLTMLEMLGLVAFYIVHLFKSDRVPENTKALWAVVLFLGNMFAMPAYWYIYIWKDLKQPSGRE